MRGSHEITFLENENEEKGENAQNGDGREIYLALKANPKDISSWPKYLYDARGSSLFEEITVQPEYYQTRSELSILRRYSKEIIGYRDFGELVELGSGSSEKTRELLEAAAEVRGEAEVRYTPLDVSESAVREGIRSLALEYPTMALSGYVGDFGGVVGDFVSSLPDDHGDKLVIFLGGTIGNFSPGDRSEFLGAISAGLEETGCLLLGIDLVKDIPVLTAAYNDSAGVTAEFNKNMLSVINDALDADFDRGLFEHRAIYNDEEQRVEMWLVSSVRQEVTIGSTDMVVQFEEGEGVRTEISNKFTREQVSDILAESGMRLVELYTDERGMFGLALAEPAVTTGHS